MNLELEKKLAEKEKSFRIFDSIYKRYDLLNHLFSLGLDNLWRYKMAKTATQKENQRLLDLAAGTGDVTFSLLKHNPQISHAHGLDMSRNMLLLAQKKSAKKNLLEKTSFLVADAGSIPFGSNCFDMVTMAFGIRNVPEPLQVLREIREVLEKEGKIVLLEFSLPKNKLIKKIHLLYLRYVIPKIGALISKDRDAYSYLNKTIETFPYGEEFCRLMRKAGFQKVRFTPLTFGVATLYQGEK
ncbi:MAG: bifunctional demethylmenaquinone methyltransferase/2-methoxy-6-polyprenyl-1,4-benzoquinol methylase UbiE [bacterium]|nr:bifunctional demethylmenaquinone methyltransferase/2-methoxy-6-polyprenyl-1,4-benzoquinol methylase UbiE [bacterium]